MKRIQYVSTHTAIITTITCTFRDYFEDKIGPVSFDFVKTSPDNQRLFVAVRFETREDAKSAMTEYSKRDLLGYRCDLTWFKDVRRFAEYQRAQGITPGRGRGGYRGRGGFGRGGYRNDRRHSRDRSRGCSGSSRSRSRSRSRGTRSESGTPRSRRRSRSNTRSKSRSLSRDRRRSSSRGSNDSRDNDYRRKDRKRRRSHHSRSNVSSDREAEHEKKADRSPSPVPPVVNPPPPQIKVTIKTTKEDMIPMPPTPSQLTSNGGMPVESPAKAYLPTAAPPPAEVPLPTPVPAPTTIGPSVNQLNTSFTIKMDTAETKIIQKTENTETVLIGSRQSQETREEQEKRIVTVNLPPTPTSVSHYMKQQEVQANTPRGSFRPVGEIQVEEQPPVKIPRHDEPLHPSQYHMNANPYNSWTPVNKYESPMSQKDSAFGYNGGTPKPSYDLSKYPLHSKLFSDLRDFQEQQIASVKAVPQEETLGSLALSTLSTNNDDVEADKRCIREQVLASMKEIELERFTIHKRKLENAFKGDCTTYAIVTKRLLSKDPSLEKQLRMCLIESMEDLEKQMFDKIDAHLGI